MSEPYGHQSPSYEPYDGARAPQPEVSPPAPEQYPTYPAYGLPAAYQVNMRTNGMAIASLVCSVVGCGVGSLLGVIFGHIAQGQIKRTGERGSGLALAGLIIGYIGLAVVVVYLLILIGLLATGDIG